MVLRNFGPKIWIQTVNQLSSYAYRTKKDVAILFWIKSYFFCHIPGDFMHAILLYIIAQYQI